MTKICPDCETEQEDSYKFCKNCGASLESVMVEEAREVEINDEKPENHAEVIEAEIVEDTIEAESIDTEKDEKEPIDAEEDEKEPIDAEEAEKESVDAEEAIDAETDEDLKRCVNCGTILHEEKFCPNCGKSTETLPLGKTCSNCGTAVDNEKFCPKCGQKLDSTAQMNRNFTYCRNCNAQIDVKAEICPKCGVRQKSPPAEHKNPLFALILSIIFPGLGQIYNGQNRKGILFIIAYILSFLLWLIVIGLILTPLIWLYGLYDAYKTAGLINKGEFTEDKLFGI